MGIRGSISRRVSAGGYQPSWYQCPSDANGTRTVPYDITRLPAQRVIIIVVVVVKCHVTSRYHDDRCLHQDETMRLAIHLGDMTVISGRNDGDTTVIMATLS